MADVWFPERRVQEPVAFAFPDKAHKVGFVGNLQLDQIVRVFEPRAGPGGVFKNKVKSGMGRLYGTVARGEVTSYNGDQFGIVLRFTTWYYTLMWRW